MFTVVELTGDHTPDLRLLSKADIIVTTPEKWDGISRSWRKRNYVQKVPTDAIPFCYVARNHELRPTLLVHAGCVGGHRRNSFAR